MGTDSATGTGRNPKSGRSGIVAKGSAKKPSAKRAPSGKSLPLKPARKTATARKTSAVKASAARFVAFIGKESATGETLIRRVREGYSVALVKHAGMYFNVPEKRVLQVIGVSGSTAHRYKTQGRPLDPAASERLHRMAVITRETEEVLGDATQAKSWLLQPNLALAGAAPFDLLDTEIGAAAVRRVLVAIAEGGVV